MSGPLAHPGPPPTPADIWTAWNPEPAVLLGLGVTAAVYGLGLARLWAAAGRGRGVRRWRAAAFAGGGAMLAVALVSPLDALGDALFAGHMAQHILLLLVVPPLLLAGEPTLVGLWALPLTARRRLGRWWNGAPAPRRLWACLGAPIVAWGLNAAAMWSWHLPALYEAALRDDRVHAVEHLCFLVSALLFWSVVPGMGVRGRLGHGPAILYLLLASVQSMFLGVWITFASKPWYAPYLTGPAAWGLSPVEDQQLAGLIMWVPGGTVYLVAALANLLQWLGLGNGGRDAERV